MPTKRASESAAAFSLTPLDKAILEHTRYDLNLWCQGYFDGQVFDYQQYFYHAPQKNKTFIAGIRTGKSRGISISSLHFSQFNPGTRFLNTSISSEQAKIVFQGTLEYCNHPNFLHWVERVQSSPYPMIRLITGSELHYRSIGYDAELIRGFEFDWINVDEAGYVTRESAIQTLRGRLIGYNQITKKPRLGILSLVSSPKGKGWLFEQWKKGDPRYPGANPRKYLSLRATIYDNPLLSQEQIAETMADYTEKMIQQELYGEFVEDNDAIFPYHFVIEGCDPDAREVQSLYTQIALWNNRRQQKNSLRQDAGLTDDITHYECEPLPGHRYVSSWDLGKKATKEGRNAMVGLVFDITHEPWIMVGYFYREGMGYVEAKAKIEEWHAKYSSNGATCRTVIDSTGKGDVMQEFIERERTIDDLEGIVYSGANKPNLVHAGKLAIERGLCRYPFIRKMIDQFSNYTLFDKDIPQDIVMAFCQAMYAAREMTRISTSSISLQRSLNGMYGAQAQGMRSPLARRNPRFTEARAAARGGRTQHSLYHPGAGGNRRGERSR